MTRLHASKPVGSLLASLLIYPLIASASPKVSGVTSNTSTISNAINSATDTGKADASSVDVGGESDIAQDARLINDTLPVETLNSAKANSSAILASVMLKNSEFKDTLRNNVTVRQSIKLHIAVWSVWERLVKLMSRPRSL